METTAGPSARAVRRIERSRARRIDLLPYVLIAPAVLLVLAVTVYPAIYALRLSVTDANLVRLAAMEYVGTNNYQKAFGDERFLVSASQTLRWVVVVAVSQMLIALPLALFLNTRFLGRAGVRASIMVPWVVPSAVVAIIWRYMVDVDHGVINDLLVRAGVLTQHVNWIGSPVSAFATVVLAQVWTGVPFYTVTVLAALQAIPGEMYEAARMDGASAWQRFRYVTLPMLIPTIALLLLLRTIWLSHSVDLIFLITGGGPGYANYTIALYSFLLTWSQLELGYPSAIAIMLAAVLLIASGFYIRIIERARDWM